MAVKNMTLALCIASLDSVFASMSIHTPVSHLIETPSSPRSPFSASRTRNQFREIELVHERMQVRSPKMLLQGPRRRRPEHDFVMSQLLKRHKYHRVEQSALTTAQRFRIFQTIVQTGVAQLLG